MTLTAKAFAKINLYLDITGKREDGYHELDSVFQSVSLFDEISLTVPYNGISVVCDKEDLSGEENIVFKACKLFFDVIGYDGGVLVKIKKNIPVAAGLAGGSADAAATLVLLNNALDKKLSAHKLCEIGKQLGADVPFCIVGGTAHVRGIGEEISPLKTPKLHYVLLKEREKQSTGKMFALIDDTNHTRQNEIDKRIDGINNADLSLVSNNLFNAFSLCWEFENMTRPFIDFSPKGVFLSGSGPTVCALFETADQAINCANNLKQNGFNAFYACSVESGVSVV